MIRGYWLPIPLWEREPDWDLESEIGLAGQTAHLIKNTYEAKDSSMPPKGPPPPPQLRTARGTVHIKQGSTGFCRINQVFRRKNQGSDGKWETPQNRIHRDSNIKSKIVASSYYMLSKKINTTRKI